MIRKSKWSGTATDEESNALMPILSLMLILIPVLLGNIAFSHLRVQHTTIPPSQPVRGVSKESSPPVFFLDLKPGSSNLRVVDETSGKDLLASISLSSLKETEIQRLFTEFSETKILIIRSAGSVNYGDAIQVIDQFQNMRRTSKLAELEIVIVPEKLK